MPPTAVGGLLDAGPERFAAALDDVERRLTDRIEELIEAYLRAVGVDVPQQ